MSRFTHKVREKFEDLRKRHWGKDHHKFEKCAPLQFRPGKLPLMVNHHLQDGQWSPTIQNLPEGSVV